MSSWKNGVIPYRLISYLCYRVIHETCSDSKLIDGDWICCRSRTYSLTRCGIDAAVDC